jgi:hypothetical protein
MDTAPTSTPKPNPETDSPSSAPAVGQNPSRLARSIVPCGSCGVPVRWAKAGEKFVAFDVEPQPDGSWMIDDETLVASWATRDQSRYGEHRYTCTVPIRSRTIKVTSEVRCPVCLFVIEEAALKRPGGGTFDRHPSCERDAEKPVIKVLARFVTKYSPRRG